MLTLRGAKYLLAEVPGKRKRLVEERHNWNQKTGLLAQEFLRQMWLTISGRKRSESWTESGHEKGGEQNVVN